MFYAHTHVYVCTFGVGRCTCRDAMCGANKVEKYSNQVSKVSISLGQQFPVRQCAARRISFVVHRSQQ